MFENNVFFFYDVVEKCDPELQEVNLSLIDLEPPSTYLSIYNITPRIILLYEYFSLRWPHFRHCHHLGQRWWY